MTFFLRLGWPSLLILMLPFLAQAQGTEPGVNEFVFVDQEPTPQNMSVVRQAIGYPTEAIAKGLEGQVMMRILVDEKGRYVRHKVMVAADSLLSKAVESHIAELTFTPAILQGKAVKFWINVPFNFRLVADEKQASEALIRQINGMIAEAPENYELYLRRGVQYREIGENDSAIADFQTSIRLNPLKKGKKGNSFANLFFAQYGLGSSFIGKGFYLDAVKAYTDALTATASIKIQDSTVNITIPSVYLERGYAYVADSSYAAAEKDYQWVLDNHPADSCTIYSLLQDLGVDTENKTLILKSIDGLIKCNPEDKLLMYSRGYYRSELEDYAGAIKDLNRVLELADQLVVKIAAHNRLSYCYMKQNKLDLAQAEIDKALKINALNPQSYYYLGQLDIARGKKDAACKNLNRAISFDLSGDDLTACEKLLQTECGK